jgi:hypothetical protein
MSLLGTTPLTIRTSVASSQLRAPSAAWLTEYFQAAEIHLLAALGELEIISQRIEEAESGELGQAVVDMVNQPDNVGRSPLFFAILSGDVRLVNILLQYVYACVLLLVWPGVFGG